MEEILNVTETDFHPLLKDVENIFWLFLLSVRTLTDVDVQNILKTKNLQEGYQPFNEMLIKFNNSINLKIDIKDNVATASANILKEMVFTGKAMAMLTYDYIINSKYETKIATNDFWKFLKFIRNASVHGNIFNMKNIEGNWKLETQEKITWRHKEINLGLHNKVAFNDFISIFDLFFLIRDLSDELKKIDTK